MPEYELTWRFTMDNEENAVAMAESLRSMVTIADAMKPAATPVTIKLVKVMGD